MYDIMKEKCIFFDDLNCRLGTASPAKGKNRDGDNGDIR